MIFCEIQEVPGLTLHTLTMIQNNLGGATWVAQLSVQLLISAQVIISQFMSSSPTLGFSLFLLLLPNSSLLSLKVSKLKKKKE